MLINHAGAIAVRFSPWRGNWQMQVAAGRPIFDGCFLGGLDVR